MAKRHNVEDAGYERLTRNIVVARSPSMQRYHNKKLAMMDGNQRARYEEKLHPKGKKRPRKAHLS